MARQPSRFNLRNFDLKNLRLRVLSAAILMPVILLAVYLGGWIFALSVTVIILLGFSEWLRLAKIKAPNILFVVAYLALLIIMGLGAFVSPACGAMIGVILVLLLFFMAQHFDHDRAGWFTLGLPYMAGSGLALLYLRDAPLIGMGLVFYLLAAVWGTDIGAFIAGRMIGGPKMAPTISPNKTWAGLFGGMVLAAVFGYCVATGFGALSGVVAIMLAVVLAAVSQLGDLFESYVKRRSGVKESGGLIPGHGGVLDRIDGLVFAAVFFVFFQVALGANLQ